MDNADKASRLVIAMMIIILIAVLAVKIHQKNIDERIAQQTQETTKVN